MRDTLFKEAISICKTIMRNGFDAYVINEQLQAEIIQATGKMEIDLACAAPLDEILRFFPSVEMGSRPDIICTLTEGASLYTFYHTDTAEASHPEAVLRRVTPGILRRLEELGRKHPSFDLALIYTNTEAKETYEHFADFAQGQIKIEGLADVVLQHDYLLGIKALRYAAVFDLPIEPNTWISIVRSSKRIIDYVPVQNIMDEWRKVEAENMWKFVKLLYESHMLHSLMPEVAALALLKEPVEGDGEETMLAHTLKCMKHYPEEEEFHHDWIGTFATMFHDIGKIYTANYYNGWTYYQHHRVSAKVARKIMHRLNMMPKTIDMVCHLVVHHMHFHFMMTDKGIRRFKALDDYQRLIAMAKADIKAHDGNYTAFNHNMKYLNRAETPEEMLEPLLNGNEIMEFTGLQPGPVVGMTRQALLKAQIAGEVKSMPDAIDFVIAYAKKMK